MNETPTAGSRVLHTRKQRFLEQALTDVTSIKDQPNKKMAEIYGGLCHRFPVLVRTCGLCQAIAFIEDKSAKNDDRGIAHKHLKSHIAGLLGLSNGSVLEDVRDADVTGYIFRTRLVLNAWVYYKRFAVSLLGIESAEMGEPDDEITA